MATVPQQLSTELEVVKRETAPVLQRAGALVVVDAQSYALADTLLSKIVTARKTVKTRLSKFLDPMKAALDSAKEAYKEAQAFHEEVDAPLSEAERTVRQRMKEFKLEEARQARIEEEKRAAAAEELRRQAAAKALAESKAKTQQMREKLAAQRAELETKVDVAEAAPAAAPVKAAGSTTRTMKVPQVIDLQELLLAVTRGIIPMNVVDINLTTIKAHYKANPQAVAKWPGLEIIEDVQIVHQSR